VIGSKNQNYPNGIEDALNPTGAEIMARLTVEGIKALKMT